MERYEYIGQAGSGAYGQVWVCRVRPLPQGEEATDGLQEGMLVACKVFRQAHTDKEIMRLALREVRVLKAINHPNCVRLLDAFKSKSGKVYLIFEYVEGCAYKELCSYRMGLPVRSLKLLAFQLCLSLRYLHGEKIVHRDLKPSNILIDNEGCVKLCDFGFARFISCTDPRDAERMSSYVVTRWYRAPEVLLSMVYGPASDIWALGCTIAELAVGEPLMPGTSTVDQLWRIMRIFGPLPPHMAVRLTEDVRLASLRVPPRGRPLAVRLNGIGPRLVQFLEACLRLDPVSRPTADELLRMPYFFEIPHLVAGTSLEALVTKELQPPPAAVRRPSAAPAAPAAAAAPAVVPVTLEAAARVVAAAAGAGAGVGVGPATPGTPSEQAQQELYAKAKAKDLARFEQGFTASAPSDGPNVEPGTVAPVSAAAAAAAAASAMLVATSSPQLQQPQQPPVPASKQPQGPGPQTPQSVYPVAAEKPSSSPPLPQPSLAQGSLGPPPAATAAASSAADSRACKPQFSGSASGPRVASSCHTDDGGGGGAMDNSGPIPQSQGRTAFSSPVTPDGTDPGAAPTTTVTVASPYTCSPHPDSSPGGTTDAGVELSGDERSGTRALGGQKLKDLDQQVLQHQIDEAARREQEKQQQQAQQQAQQQQQQKQVQVQGQGQLQGQTKQQQQQQQQHEADDGNVGEVSFASAIQREVSELLQNANDNPALAALLGGSMAGGSRGGGSKGGGSKGGGSKSGMGSSKGGSASLRAAAAAVLAAAEAQAQSMGATDANASQESQPSLQGWAAAASQLLTAVAMATKDSAPVDSEERPPSYSLLPRLLPQPDGVRKARVLMNEEQLSKLQAGVWWETGEPGGSGSNGGEGGAGSRGSKDTLVPGSLGGTRLLGGAGSLGGGRVLGGAGGGGAGSLSSSRVLGVGAGSVGGETLSLQLQLNPSGSRSGAVPLGGELGSGSGSAFRVAPGMSVDLSGIACEAEVWKPLPAKKPLVPFPTLQPQPPPPQPPLQPSEPPLELKPTSSRPQPQPIAQQLQQPMVVLAQPVIGSDGPADTRVLFSAAQSQQHQQPRPPAQSARWSTMPAGPSASTSGQVPLGRMGVSSSFAHVADVRRHTSVISSPAHTMSGAPPGGVVGRMSFNGPAGLPGEYAGAGGVPAPMAGPGASVGVDLIMTGEHTSSIGGLSCNMADFSEVLTPMGAPHLPSCVSIIYPHRRPMLPSRMIPFSGMLSTQGSGNWSPSGQQALLSGTQAQTEDGGYILKSAASMDSPGRSAAGAPLSGPVQRGDANAAIEFAASQVADDSASAGRHGSGARQRVQSMRPNTTTGAMTLEREGPVGGAPLPYDVRVSPADAADVVTVSATSAARAAAAAQQQQQQQQVAGARRSTEGPYDIVSAKTAPLQTAGSYNELASGHLSTSGRKVPYGSPGATDGASGTVASYSDPRATAEPVRVSFGAVPGGTATNGARSVPKSPTGWSRGTPPQRKSSRLSLAGTPFSPPPGASDPATSGGMTPAPAMPVPAAHAILGTVGSGAGLALAGSGGSIGGAAGMAGVRNSAVPTVDVDSPNSTPVGSASRPYPPHLQPEAAGVGSQGAGGSGSFRGREAWEDVRAGRRGSGREQQPAGSAPPAAAPSGLAVAGPAAYARGSASGRGSAGGYSEVDGNTDGFTSSGISGGGGSGSGTGGSRSGGKGSLLQRAKHKFKRLFSAKNDTGGSAGSTK